MDFAPGGARVTQEWLTALQGTRQGWLTHHLDFVVQKGFIVGLYRAEPSTRAFKPSFRVELSSLTFQPGFRAELKLDTTLIHSRLRLGERACAAKHQRDSLDLVMSKGRGLFLRQNEK